MFCVNCGAELPDEANFCWKCGKPHPAHGESDQAQWERCEIVCLLVDDPALFASWYDSTHWFHSAWLQFRAEATGPKGHYVTAESEAFRSEPTFPPAADDRQALDAFHSLFQRLVADGWQLLEDRGDAWYSSRFRRPLRQPPARERQAE